MTINCTTLLFSLNQYISLDILVWMLGIPLLIAATAMVFIQLRNYKKLKADLKLLEKMNTHTVEYDLVLKTMKILIWRVDVNTHTVSLESDYRDKSDSVILPPGTTVEDVFALIDERDQENIKHEMEDLMKGRIDEFHVQYRMKLPNSEHFYWSEGFACIDKRDLTGKPVSLVGATMRIDQQKEIEDALMDAVYHAEESDRLKSAFLANISHEIRTPLNAIVGFSDVLVMVDDEAERQKLIDLIKQNNAHLLRLFDDIVNMSKLEARGGGALKKTVFALGDVFKELTDRYCFMADEKGLKLEVTPTDALPMLNTDRDRIKEILSQYLNNALKFTTEGSVTLGGTVIGDKLRIWVRDTGKGIPKDKCNEKLFERFVKVDEFVPGTGLGLSICRSLAMTLHGEVGLESELGVGSTFWVELEK